MNYKWASWEIKPEKNSHASVLDSSHSHWIRSRTRTDSKEYIFKVSIAIEGILIKVTLQELSRVIARMHLRIFSSSKRVKRNCRKVLLIIIKVKLFPSLSSFSFFLLIIIWRSSVLSINVFLLLPSSTLWVSAIHLMRSHFLFGCFSLGYRRNAKRSVKFILCLV